MIRTPLSGKCHGLEIRWNNGLNPGIMPLLSYRSATSLEATSLSKSSTEGDFRF